MIVDVRDRSSSSFGTSSFGACSDGMAPCRLGAVGHAAAGRRARRGQHRQRYCRRAPEVITITISGRAQPWRAANHASSRTVADVTPDRRSSNFQSWSTRDQRLRPRLAPAWTETYQRPQLRSVFPRIVPHPRQLGCATSTAIAAVRATTLHSQQHPSARPRCYVAQLCGRTCRAVRRFSPGGEGLRTRNCRAADRERDRVG